MASTGGILLIGSIAALMTRAYPSIALALTVIGLAALVKPSNSGLLVLMLQPVIALAVGGASAWLMLHRRTR